MVDMHTFLIKLTPKEKTVGAGPHNLYFLTHFSDQLNCLPALQANYEGVFFHSQDEIILIFSWKRTYGPQMLAINSKHKKHGWMGGKPFKVGVDHPEAWASCIIVQKVRKLVNLLYSTAVFLLTSLNWHTHISFRTTLSKTLRRSKVVLQ